MPDLWDLLTKDRHLSFNERMQRMADEKGITVGELARRMTSSIEPGPQFDLVEQVWIYDVSGDVEPMADGFVPEKIEINFYYGEFHTVVLTGPLNPADLGNKYSAQVVKLLQAHQDEVPDYVLALVAELAGTSGG